MSAADYLPKRIALLEKEKELTRARDELTKERQALPIVKVKKDYAFTDLDASGNKVTKSLAELFDGREQLIIYHFMFGPDAEEGCASCTVLSDGISSQIPHLNSRGTTLVCVSRAPIEKIEAYKKRLGFTFPWVSSYESEFNPDHGVTMLEDDPDATYNFTTKEQLEEKRMPWFTKGEQPGMSTFIMGDSTKGIGEDGAVYHTYSSYARAGESMTPLFAWLDSTKLGRRDGLPQGKAGGTGFRRHDEYSEAELKGNWD